MGCDGYRAQKEVSEETFHQINSFFYVFFSLVFTNGPGDLGSIPGHLIPKTLKMVLDTALLNTQQYKVRIKGKVEKSMEKCSSLPYT